MFNFEKLSVYQKSIDFVNSTYTITDKWPKTEVFGLSGQFRRAAVSISPNIAEGSGRTKKDFRHFLDIARSSCYECVALLQIAQSREYLNTEEYEHFYKKLEEISKQISGLKNALT
jgi:four helix bundle protein